MYKTRQIIISTNYHEAISGEQYAQELLFSHQISGELHIKEDGQVQKFLAGSFRLVRSNRLITYHKQPSETSPYLSLSVSFKIELLRSFADLHGYHPRYRINSPSVIELKKLPLYEAHATALRAFDEVANGELIHIKVRETLLRGFEL